MDTYSIFKAAKIHFKTLLREQNSDKDYDDYWYECEANDWANSVVESAVKEGMFYPFSELNKPKELYPPLDYPHPSGS